MSEYIAVWCPDCDGTGVVEDDYCLKCGGDKFIHAKPTKPIEKEQNYFKLAIHATWAALVVMVLFYLFAVLSYKLVGML